MARRAPMAGIDWTEIERTIVDNCIICGAPTDRSRPVTAVSANPPVKVMFFGCTRCRSLSSQDALDRVEELYRSRESANFDGEKSAWMVRLKAFLLRRSYLRDLRRHEIGRIVDYGCGRGDLANTLYAAGFAAIAVDVLPDRPPFLAPAIEYHSNGDLRELPKGPRTAIILRHVLEHVAKPREVLAALAKAAGPGDIFILEFPSVDSALKKLMGKYWPGYYPPFHVSVLDDHAVADEARALGLDMKSKSHPESPVVAAYISQRLGILNNTVRVIGLIAYPVQYLISRALARSESVKLVFIKR